MRSSERDNEGMKERDEERMTGWGDGGQNE